MKNNIFYYHIPIRRWVFALIVFSLGSGLFVALDNELLSENNLLVKQLIITLSATLVGISLGAFLDTQRRKVIQDSRERERAREALRNLLGEICFVNFRKLILFKSHLLKAPRPLKSDIMTWMADVVADFSEKAYELSYLSTGAGASIRDDDVRNAITQIYDEIRNIKSGIGLTSKIFEQQKSARELDGGHPPATVAANKIFRLAIDAVDRAINLNKTNIPPILKYVDNIGLTFKTLNVRSGQMIDLLSENGFWEFYETLEQESTEINY